MVRARFLESGCVEELPPKVATILESRGKVEILKDGPAELVIEKPAKTQRRAVVDSARLDERV